MQIEMQFSAVRSSALMPNIRDYPRIILSSKLIILLQNYDSVEAQAAAPQNPM